MAVRYDTRQDDEGWTVFDIFTGQPVEVGEVRQMGLDGDDADDLADLLNYQESLKLAGK